MMYNSQNEELGKSTTKPVIISASRMTDMPAFYPQKIIDQTEIRRDKGIPIHSLVLWTKHPKSLLINPLNEYLQKIKKDNIQIYIQLTITGIGKSRFVEGFRHSKVYLEPGVPDYTESIENLDRLIELTGNPGRIRFRIDPVIRIRDAANKQFSNLSLFEYLVDAASKKGIRDFTFSFLEKGMHRKVDARFEREHLEILSPTPEERTQMTSWIHQLSVKKGVQISSCCVPGMQTSACIDGILLKQLHDLNPETDFSQPKSRPLCGCTKSIDIGGWPPLKCYSGCLYCYATPVLR